MLPKYDEAWTKLLENLPDASQKCAVSFLRREPLSHLLASDSQEEREAGDDAYASMRRAADYLGLSIALDRGKRLRKGEWGMRDKNNLIFLDATMTSSHLANVGIHECTHAFFHPRRTRNTTQATLNREEWEAELSAYFFSWTFGITSVDSGLYICQYRATLADLERIAHRCMAYANVFRDAGVTRVTPTEI